MTRRVHRDDTPDVAQLRARLDRACITVATVLDGGERDPTWGESQELESAAIELGRALQQKPRRSTADVFVGKVLP